MSSTAQNPTPAKPLEDTRSSLRESEARCRCTFEQSTIGVIHTTVEGEFLRCNHRFAAIVRYQPEELIGMSFRQLTLSEDIDASDDRLRILIDGSNELPSWEKRCIRKDGSLTWVRLTASALRDEQGAVLYFIVLVEDINDRKFIEARLEDAYRQSATLQETVTRLKLAAALKADAAALAAEKKARDATTTASAKA